MQVIKEGRSQVFQAQSKWYLQRGVQPQHLLLSEGPLEHPQVRVGLRLWGLEAF